jgi:translation initiation factor IF-2
MINDENNQSRKTLSISSVNGAAPRRVNSGSGVIEVEVKKKKRGLAIDVDDAGLSRRTGADRGHRMHGSVRLTDQEFKARVEALQNAMKEEEARSSTDTDAVNNNIQVERDKSDDTAAQTEQTSPEKKQREPHRQQPVKVAVEEVKNAGPVVFRASGYGGNARKRAEPAGQPAGRPQVTRPITRPQAETSETHRKKVKVFVKAKQPEKKQTNYSNKVSRTVLNRVLNDEAEGRARSIASIKRARLKQKGGAKDQESAKVVRDVNIPDSVTVGELANRMAVRSSEIVKYLMSTGIMATVSQVIDGDTAEVVCVEFGHVPRRISDSDIESEIVDIASSAGEVCVRPPIIAVMGHVDHGKTTLLDMLRKTSVAQKEAGGITQHVAAYQIQTKSGKKITLIDTPGHAAFSGIRKRGAVITDIIVLVVAADDGVKTQTIEIINQAKSQNVPIIVAINKIDKPNINLDKIRSELMVQDVILEDFGGNVLSVEISALNNINLDGLVDTILLQSDMLELEAGVDRKAGGTVLESRIDKGRGIISSVIIQYGTLRVGDVFVAGAAYGKVRSIYDDKGKKVLSAGPSTPVEIVGFNASPEPGGLMVVVDSEQKAREVAEYRARSLRASSGKAAKSIDQMMQGSAEQVQDLIIVVKADVYGSLEAIVASVESIIHPEIKVKVAFKGIGIISENDIDFAVNTSAIVIGFNVSATNAAKELSNLHKIKITHYNIIYNVIEDIKNAMAKRLSPIVEENYIGTADVRKLFTISRLGTIAGCYVIHGLIKKASSKIKVKRGDIYIFEGEIKSIKHEKDEIKESKYQHECGILANGFNEFLEGDRIECYEIVFKSRSLE